MRARSLLIAAALTLAALGVRPAVASTPPARGTAPSGPSHIAVIIFENHEASAILGPNSDAPYFRSLAASSVNLTGLYATSHPSLPNYLALTSGSTHGITSDCTTCFVHARNIVDQLEHAGISWKAYMESIPGPCSSEAFAGLYALKHDPFLYYDDVRNNTNRCNKVVSLGQLRTDLNADALPRFAWITPNLCNDMHDCSVATGDAFLQRWIPKIGRHLGSNGIVVVVFDEGTTAATCCGVRSGGGHVAAIIAGPGAARSVRIGSSANHYSLLRLVEDAFGLHRLRHAADRATPPIRGWRG